MVGWTQPFNPTPDKCSEYFHLLPLKCTFTSSRQQDMFSKLIQPVWADLPPIHRRRLQMKTKRRKLSLMTTFKSPADADTSHLSCWSLITVTAITGIKSTEMDQKERPERSSTEQKWYSRRPLQTSEQRRPDYPLWWEGLSQNNESKSNERQITPLTLCFSSSLISTQTLHHFHSQTHNFTISAQKQRKF